MAFSDVVAMMKDQVDKADPSKIKGVNATFQFELSGDDEGTFHLNVADGNVEMVEGASDSPNVTIMMDSEDFKSMLNGELNATSAFMAGKLKVKGDMSLAMKLQALVS